MNEKCALDYLLREQECYVRKIAIEADSTHPRANRSKINVPLTLTPTKSPSLSDV